MKNKAAASRLIPQLSKLAAEIVEDRSTLDACLEEAGPEVVESVQKLAQSLSVESNVEGSHEASSSGPPAPVFSNNTNNPISANGVPTPRPSPSLPHLPLIQDARYAQGPFTHPAALSAAQLASTDAANLNYDRLEFLGDAYIEIISTRLLYSRFPSLPTGRLAGIRENLVKNETLSKYALRYGFDKKANIPPEHRREPSKFTKATADVFEAYVAAVILSDPAQGFARADAWLRALWEPQISAIGGLAQKADNTSKGELQKKIKGVKTKIEYRDERPPANIDKGRQMFFIAVYFTGWGWENELLGRGEGYGKSEAGNLAAAAALANTPLIDNIAAVKKAYDLKVKREREEAAAAQAADQGKEIPIKGA